MLSNLHLLERCKRYILTNPSRTDVDDLIKDALTGSFREIQDLSAEPLAWNREVYDKTFTRYYAAISAITAADPGIITADSLDPDLTTDHGFQTGDIVYLDGVNSENSRHRLNNRIYRVVRINATTLSLKTLDGADDVDTTDYEAYDSGGHIYHAGIVLPSTVEPTGATGNDVNYEWDIKRIYDVEFDLYPADPVTEAVAQRLSQSGSRPEKWRYQQYAYGTFGTPEHILFWYNFPSQRYNVRIHIEKDYPDLSDFSDAVYPPCPGPLHEYIWHRALSTLSMHTEKQKRKTAESGDNTKVEILNANYWMAKTLQEEMKILEYSRKLSGGKAHMRQGMSA